MGQPNLTTTVVADLRWAKDQICRKISCIQHTELPINPPTPTSGSNNGASAKIPKSIDCDMRQTFVLYKYIKMNQTESDGFLFGLCFLLQTNRKY